MILQGGVNHYPLLSPNSYLIRREHNHAKSFTDQGEYPCWSAFACDGLVPTQEFDTPYDPVLAFSRGTIFPALDKPFLGEEAVPQ